MEAVLEQIEEWFRNMLIEGIMEHLTNTFDSMNTEVGEIARVSAIGLQPDKKPVRESDHADCRNNPDVYRML